MHQVKGDTFLIEKKEDELVFSGDLESREYEGVPEFFEYSFKHIKGDTVVFNFMELFYLNTHGVNLLGRIIYDNPGKKIHIITNNKIEWQKTSVDGLIALSPDRVSTENRPG